MRQEKPNREQKVAVEETTSEIPLCSGYFCPMKGICYRALIRPLPKDQIFVTPPISGHGCKYLLPVIAHEAGEQ
jgi:hypothetical protein